MTLCRYCQQPFMNGGDHPDYCDWHYACEPVTDRAANNRKIAEWLEPKPTIHPRGLGRVTTAWIFSDEIDLTEERMVGWQPRDFYNDETASAAARDKMMLNHRAVWMELMRKVYHKYAVDDLYRELVAEACLRLIEQQHTEE